MGTAPIQPAPRALAYSRRGDHSRPKRTWSSTSGQDSSQYALLRRKASTSSAETGASGSARSPDQAANAELALYGDPYLSGGPTGSICHTDWPAAASQSTKAYADGPRRPSGRE